MTNQKIVFGSFAIVVLVVMFGFLVMLYALPNFRPMGLTGVFIKSKYMSYVDADIAYIFDQDNFIIESDSAEIHIRVRSEGQKDQGLVQVYEDANGIAFNSTKRTQVDFLETIDPKTGIVSSKILVKEPKGMIARTARVYINLKTETIASRSLRHDFVGYNFTLNTGRSPVTFEIDNAEEATVSNIAINTLNINGIGRVTVASHATRKYTWCSINDMNINSPNAYVEIQSEIANNVNVDGNSKTIRLANIGRDLTVDGAINNINVGNVGGNTLFKSQGSITTKDIAGNFTVRADVVNSVNVALVGGNFDARSEYNENEYISSGSISVDGVMGTSFVRMDKGGLYLGASGAKTIGEQTVELGVRGNVDINKYQGGLTVRFANIPSVDGECKIRASSGDIRAFYIRGLCDIVTTSYGESNVIASFAPNALGTITEGSKITIQGSWEASKTNTRVITVTFLDGLSANVFYGWTNLDTGKTVGSSKATVFNRDVLDGNPFNGKTLTINAQNKTDIEAPPDATINLTVQTANRVDILG